MTELISSIKITLIKRTFYHKIVRCGRRHACTVGDVQDSMNFIIIKSIKYSLSKINHREHFLHGVKLKVRTYGVIPLVFLTVRSAAGNSYSRSKKIHNRTN